MKITRKDFLLLSSIGLTSVAGNKLVRAIAAAEPSTAESRRKRWGMVIDLQKCRQDNGCKECIAACDQRHNIPQISDPAHEVKWIWTEKFDAVFPSQADDYTRQTFTSHPIPVACNHCTEPPCTRVCPTGATWKRDEDGFVMMDWHRCIGCKYCMVACPYGARSFNFTDPRPHIRQINPDFPTRESGVVEKCNFCADLLAEGKQPAWVGACREQAMTFGDLADANSEVRRLLRSRYSIRRKPELGTQPNVFYLV